MKVYGMSLKKKKKNICIYIYLRKALQKFMVDDNAIGCWKMEGGVWSPLFLSLNHLIIFVCNDLASVIN